MPHTDLILLIVARWPDLPEATRRQVDALVRQ